MIKLTKLKDLNKENLHKVNSGEFAKDYKILDQLLPKVFPNENMIRAIIKRHKAKKDSYRHDEYILDCLPHHLRDERWLSKYLHRYLREKSLTGDIDLDCLTSYVKTPNFKKACGDFADKFISAKLRSMMVSTRAEHETIVDAGFPDMSHRIDCDVFFRQHALSYFILKGFDRNTIEINLEKNADIWRKDSMRQAFENICNLEIVVHDFPKKNRDIYEFYHKKYEYRKLWLEYREYEYYRRHKEYVDKTGLATNAMKLSPDEVSKLIHDMDIAEKNMIQVLTKKYENEKPVENKKPVENEKEI